MDRSTVYRALGRMQVPVGRTKQERLRDMRRFAYSHRMEMVLADGKHFRAGIARARRVALFFLDDATRRGLHVVVGTSEKAELFLRGLYECLCAHGRMGILYLDQGPGFLAKAVAQVCRRLEIALVYGERRYPQGHGKIERLNQTAWHAVLRSLDGRCEVDPAPVALELRLRHWLLEAYNHQPHEAHRTPAGRLETPMQRWSADERALWTVSRDEIRSAFVTYAQRTVSRDRLVSVRGTFYELPLSLAPGGRQGPRVWIHEQVLDATLHVVCPHEGLVRIHPVDVPANARTRRRRRGSRGRGSAGVLPPSAADMAYERDLGSVLDADGGMSASGGPSSP